MLWQGLQSWWFKFYRFHASLTMTIYIDQKAIRTTRTWAGNLLLFVVGNGSWQVLSCGVSTRHEKRSNLIDVHQDFLTFLIVTRIIKSSRLCHLFHIHNLCHLIHYCYCHHQSNHNIVIIITIIIIIIIIKIIIIVIFILCTSPITVSFVSRSFWSNPSILLQLREVWLMYHMCNIIHVIAFLSSPSEFQTLCVHLASVSIVRIW